MIESKAMLNDKTCLWIMFHEWNLVNNYSEIRRPTLIDGFLRFYSPELGCSPLSLTPAKSEHDTITVYFRTIDKQEEKQEMINYLNLERTQLESFQKDLIRLVEEFRNFRTNNVELLNEVKLASNQIDDAFGTLEKAKFLVKDK